MTVDVKVYDLAVLFLKQANLHPKVYADQLAEEIQEVIEEFVEREGGTL